MQRKAHLLFLPASRRVRGEFERGLPLIYGVQLVQLVSMAESHGLKKAVQRFLLICFLGFETVVFSTVSSYLDTIRNNVILKNWDKPLTQLGLGVL